MKRLVVPGLGLVFTCSLVAVARPANPEPVMPRASPADARAPAALDPILSPYMDPAANPYVAAAEEPPPSWAPARLDPTLSPYADPQANPYATAAARPVDRTERPPAPASLDPLLTPYVDPSVNPYLSSQEPTPPATPAAPAAPAPGSPAKPAPEARIDPIDPYATPPGAASAIPRRVGIADVTAVQGLLAVQRLDAWLLFDRDGENPIAVRLVAPEGHPTRPWFYMIPARGNPVALVHTAELRSFDHLAGTKLTYQGYRDLDKQLRAMLKGVKSVAVEYSAKAAVPSVSRVDAGTLEVIRASGVQVRSSDTLVQFTKAIWGDPGRTAHYVAVHHLVELRKEALAFVVKQLSSGAAVTEHDVQQRIVHGMAMRGLVGPPPVVAAGVNTADPYYVPTAEKTAPIKRGDLIVISLAAKVDRPEGIYAVQTWCAVADARVPEPIAKAFETASLARDHAMSLITDRLRKHRAVTGAEVDDATRAFLKKAGLVDRVMHRTGHSIDNDLQGSGADLDDFEVKDTRILTPGTGFTVGPGLYFPGQFGVRAEISVYLAPGGPEVTTPAQDDVEALLRREAH
ncbi:MAG TPA: M24 family metallopeptidase [Kofleriaceae bacterium]|nr:M24 family metallopeptidase [Kofleriaceae bacterium]